jgi:dTDP-4-dehydrorhamnose reductase
VHYWTTRSLAPLLGSSCGNMKILITGGSGLLGAKLAQIALEKGHEVFLGYNHNKPEIGIPIHFDLRIEKSIRNILHEAQPEIVFHTAALTDVDRCEIDKKLACQINSRATKYLAEEAKKLDSFVIYVSTESVFDGERGMYTEEDITNPINHYGYSKLIAERYCDCVARTGVLYGSNPASGKINFALWVYDKLKKKEQIKIVTDQFNSPVLNTNLAKMLLEIGNKKMKGIFHLTGATRISRYDFVCLLSDTFGLDKSIIIPSKMVDMGWKAKRPKDCSMHVGKAMKMLEENPYDIITSLNIFKEEIYNAERNCY